MAFANRVQKDALSGQVDLFGMSDEHAHVSKPQLTLEKAATQYNQREQLLWERELLGLAPALLETTPLGFWALAHTRSSRVRLSSSGLRAVVPTRFSGGSIRSFHHSLCSSTRRRTVSAGLSNFLSCR